MEENIYLSTFGKHVPRILKHQIISKLVNQYVQDHGVPCVKVVDSSKDVDGDASIVRFHCSMLFVDISGFTVLSQRLKVDELKEKINNYFELIVSIILKYDGEIIKFAGDAIFVVFQTKVNSTEDAGFAAACKEVVDTAVVCGKEVLAKCGHYPVELNKDGYNDSTVASMELFESLDAGTASGTATTPASASRKAAAASYAAGKPEGPSVTFLDVHCGVSMGVMAGIDVGAAGRFEYLIMGQPMSDVAIAEGDAAKGELVISPEVHNFLHRYSGPLPGASGKQPAAAAPAAASADAKKTAPQVGEEGGGCFFFGRRTPKVYPKEAQVAPGPPSASLFRQPSTPDKPGDRLPCGCCVTNSGFFLINNDPKAAVDPLVGKTRAPRNLLHMECKEVLNDVGKAFAPVRQQLHKLSVPSKAWAAAPVDRRAKVLEAHFREWTRECLIDDIATHVHDVSRQNYELHTLEDRVCPLSAYLRSFECEEALRGAEAVREDVIGTNAVGKTVEALSTVSELRSVIVMFINIKMENSTVFIDPAPKNRIKTCGTDEFSFLARTEAELAADVVLRDKFQKCFAVMAQTFADKGGQVRQFIVDDKGTVCIGTFGLRGAVNYDNASASIETAELIIHGLQALGIGASIGLTSGTGYCGLVGSTFRHEYAIMGPSINLSARLMCRAAEGEVICDADTRNRDRQHNFTTLAAVQAKGYSQLVPTFRPQLNLFKEVISRPEAPDLSVSVRNTEGTKVKKLDKMKKTKSFFGQAATKLRNYAAAHKIHGRAENIAKVVNFMFPSADLERFSEEFFMALDVGDFSSPSKLGSGKKTAVVFDITKPTRLVGIVGPHGIGKTALLDLFQDQLTRLQDKRSYNIQVFRHRVGYINSSSPFSAWMCMIIHELFYVAQWWYANIADEETRKNTVVTFNEIGKGLEYILQQLSPELQELRPLLCDIGLHPPLPDTEATALLKGTARLYRTADLLAGFLEQFPRITGKLAFMIMDDIQNNDAVSQYMLRKVWADLRGVSILCTYRPKSKGALSTGSSTPTSVSSRSTRATSRSSADIKDFLDIPIVDFLTIMDESDTFQRVLLPVLDKKASRALLADFFDLYNISDVDEGVYEKMYELSGGNALYATELAKGVVQKRAVLLDTTTSVPSLSKLLAEMRTVRVEEIVYYRFDQLFADWQIVLKIAAVASSNGAPFSIPMLDYLIKRDKYFRKAEDEAVDLYSIINAMLAANEFIYMKNMSPWVPIVDRGNAHEDFDVEVMQKLFMSWNFAMEQRAIYDLLLDEQKQSLHALMVEYLASANADPSSADLAERAHHYESARQFAAAMKCFYEAGMKLHGKGAHYDALKLFSAAQRMLAKLRAAAGISEDKQGWKMCTPQKVHEVFAGDMAMAEVAVRAVLRLAQSLLIFVQGEVDAELAKLARKNALLFLEQAHFMIKLSTEAVGGLELTALQELFWECYASGPVAVPEDSLKTAPRDEVLQVMQSAIDLLRASAPIAEDEEGDDAATVAQ